ncbi:rhodanese-like domain-containing protein [Planctomycetota bacterium]|nr:rhodanese-like domain-containing protein [Planctomycetota bacterium]
MALKKNLMDLANEVRSMGIVEEIDAEEFKALIDEEEGEAVVVVDVREPEEYAQGHVPGAVNVPRGVIEMKLEKACFDGNASEADLERPVVLYCAGGHRSVMAGKSLCDQGFTDVRSLEGGMNGYVQADGEVEV